MSEQNRQGAVADVPVSEEQLPKEGVIQVLVHRDLGDEDPGVEDEPHVVRGYN